MIAIMGESFFVNRVIRELQKKGIEASYVELRSSKTALRKTLKSHKIIHFIGSPTVSMDFIKLILFKIWGKKIIVSWIGFDMRKARQILSRKIISKLCQPFISVNLAADDHTIKNLNALGIKAKLLPPPFYHLFQLRELPKDDKIAVYLPDMPQTLWDFYHGDWIKRLVNDLPTVEFIIIKNSGKNFSEKNVKCFSWVEEMENLYSQVKAVIRLPKEDSTGLTIIETLSMGRNMIASGMDFPYCKITNNYEELKNHVKSIINNSILNVDGSEYVHKNYNNTKFSNALIEVYNSLL